MATKDEMKEKLGKGMSAYFSSLSSEQPPVITAETPVMNDLTTAIREKSSVVSDESPRPVDESTLTNDKRSKDNDGLSVITDEPSQSMGKVPAVEVKSPVISDDSSMTIERRSVTTDEGGEITIDQEALAIAIAEAKKNPRVPLWSEMSKTLLLYNQLIRDKRLVRPRVSLSEEGSSILDEAVQKAFPEMCKMIEKELKKSA